MSTRRRVLVAEPEGFSPAVLSLLRQAADVELHACTRGELRRAFGVYDAIWVRLGHRIDRDIVVGGSRCRVLAVPTTGLDHIDLDACQKRGVRVVSLRGEVAFLRDVRATAELSVCLALALVRKLPQAVASVRAGRWERDRFRGRELYGKTAGIVGIGRLGNIVGSYFAGLGMHVIGFDPNPMEPGAQIERVETLDVLLRSADLVSVHVSYDASTRNLIDRRALLLMKNSAILINTSRGGVIDELALLDALEKGEISGAALDVLDGEPEIDGDHPLVRAAATRDDLLLVPHIGGNTVESFEKTERFIARKVIAALEEMS